MAASKRDNIAISDIQDDTTPSESAPPQPATQDVAGHTAPASSEADRAELIRQAAYALSEQRGFEPGRDVDDWLDAERQVDGNWGGKAA